MTAVLRLPNDRARDDLATYLGRAARIEGGAVRLQAVTGAGGDAVAVWVPVLRPQTILDDSPIVLGMRAIGAVIESPEPVDLRDGSFDAAVPLRGMLDRLASDREQHRLELPLPVERPLESWAAVSPPRGQWERLGAIAGAELAAAADRGIADVARAVPGNLGTLLVERARTEVWTAPLDVPGASGHGLVAGAAFAAHALGFITDAPAVLSRSGVWLRVSTTAGHVLTKARLATA
ncbi:hypothetical protein GCM10011490_28620 [Pseudoclavibacter endophyticus]|uniref:Uncharacterized protein n=1 Tax=Pseudoclavibacter endophyticus TaxID=1778590 RepID=A0A6H9WIU0_9MICO|nr:hypothetical protein [Pseudoclavibacter endophyticus]KAB1646723.1 hypothetical protein F8O04_13325 [Pseudoclavibacter endophyticus]GGA76102.1 hypothetical protein GCM10011490_28620 [Pseudoclavibacter endophyticus]